MNAEKAFEGHNEGQWFWIPSHACYRSIAGMIAEWRKGCSCAPSGNPSECQPCTEALIAAIEREVEPDHLMKFIQEWQSRPWTGRKMSDPEPQQFVESPTRKPRVWIDGKEMPCDNVKIDWQFDFPVFGDTPGVVPKEDH